MSLDAINVLKEQAASYQCILLATITASDAAVFRLSTSDLSSYGGSAYSGRVLRYDLQALQAMSEQGLDVMPSVTLTVADADKTLYSWDRTHGIAGARIALVFVYYDHGTQYSSDSYKVFTGRCKPGGADDLTFTIQATSLLNLNEKRLPSTPIQRTCPWIHPDTAGQKALAATVGSLYYRCGDVGAATSCDKSPTACKANGMWALGRFGGIQWIPPSGTRTEREYVSGSRVQVKSSINSARYGEYVPLVWGAGWVDAVVLSIIPDGNSTRGEALVCDGGISGLLKVIVDDEEVPPANSFPARNAYNVYDALFRYNVWGNGTRDGAVNTDAGFDSLGDPYGSLVAIEYCLPRKTENPRVRVLVQGRKIRVYTDAVTYTTIYSTNPIWIIADILNLAGLSFSDMDLASFVAAAAYCDATVSYTDQYGDTSTRARFAASLVVRQRRGIGDIINGLRRGCNAMLLWSGSSGKVEIYIKQTLADQQGSAVDGSNDDNAVTSKNADGTAASGYLAYHFHDYDTMEIRRLSMPDAPNVAVIGFANSEREYSADSLRIVDINAINFDGQEKESNVQAEGITTLNQARNIGGTYLAEMRRGNARADAKGSEPWEIQSTAKAVKLRVGQIVGVTNTKYQL